MPKNPFSIHFASLKEIRDSSISSPISGFLAETSGDEKKSLNPNSNQNYLPEMSTIHFLIVKITEIERTHKIIKAVFRGIEFTLKCKLNGTLPFLDVFGYRKAEGSIESSVYRKWTHTDQILSYHSNHPNAPKNCIQTLSNRIEMSITLTHYNMDKHSTAHKHLQASASRSSQENACEGPVSKSAVSDNVCMRGRFGCMQKVFDGLMCIEYERWYHKPCTNFTTKEYDSITTAKKSYIWYHSSAS